jgi:hypothetical protein
LGNASVIGAFAQASFQPLQEAHTPKLPRNGHAPGHVRDTALAAFHAWLEWDPSTESEPTVEYEIRHVPRQITIFHACGLVWNCTDIVPGWFLSALRDEGLNICRQTYAACARAIVEDIKAHKVRAKIALIPLASRPRL